jgi:ribonuclease J
LIPSQNDFWFLPLGGANEIGMNLNLYGHDGRWLMVDFGVLFGDRLGVEIVTPDISFILKQRQALAGLVLTHAHEDHIGAIPYLWDQLKCPLYATPFTAAVIRKKLEEYVEFVTLTHSIPEPNSVVIRTPLGTVLHTGDWKIDPNPLIGDAVHADRLKAIGDEGVRALVCDSTNVFNEGTSGSEADVRKELIHLVTQFPNVRVAVCCFASNVARLESAMEAARASNRKVVLLGRSIKAMVESAVNCGYLKHMPEIIDDRHAKALPREQVLLIMTGSQGEQRAALPRIASQQHPTTKLDEGDVVVFSSRVIPGNERSISFVQNQLALQGIEVLTSHQVDVHVSGHPARDELRQMYKWIRPQTLIPIHGDAMHLREHARLAQSEGLNDVLIPQNGTLINLLTSQILETIPTGRWCLDGSRMIASDSMILKDRAHASVHGVVSVGLAVNARTELQGKPQIKIRGLVQDGSEMDQTVKALQRSIQRMTLAKARSGLNRLEDELYKDIRRYFRVEFEKTPMICVQIIVV